MSNKINVCIKKKTKKTSCFTNEEDTSQQKREIYSKPIKNIQKDELTPPKLNKTISPIPLPPSVNGKSVLEQMKEKQNQYNHSPSITFTERYSSLPSEVSVEEYDKIPIENFGIAMLKGMGWKE
ncbi:hypothetical protein CL6EHI_001860 [Entamoeba histolytica]|uniref:Spp2/MOS2 G-patch domain-containing protein n=3 Tax=Entamoeba histolytica TaxID=5759 RepID=C4M5K0_ENTH1|nr:hypothetical protein EHI_001860 [Entamoeba histolytica HM-1:IMSS]EAL44656.1 hypothetical protein EHI_001860 [Entamoeba histolytica HM-1:IMSS]EMD46169.1 Hypothetical protein EHI5A_220880 [Entamoeba histolytica KU27]GAT96708.1 hypothetical protein CL6EHI_001860 [Entamoeba histolytica]|eukprot:XP_650042.1 hypothetical protein EHI_001860 [Entamoeba histolytica HM-1:IMSS]